MEIIHAREEFFPRGKEKKEKKKEIVLPSFSLRERNFGWERDHYIASRFDARTTFKGGGEGGNLKMISFSYKSQYVKFHPFFFSERERRQVVVACPVAARIKGRRNRNRFRDAVPSENEKHFSFLIKIL